MSELAYSKDFPAKTVLNYDKNEGKMLSTADFPTSEILLTNPKKIHPEIQAKRRKFNETFSESRPWDGFPEAKRYNA